MSTFDGGETRGVHFRYCSRSLFSNPRFRMFGLDTGHAVVLYTVLQPSLPEPEHRSASFPLSLFVLRVFRTEPS